MRLRGALLLLLTAGACYDAPTGAGPCSITCTTECPGDLTCQNGFCVGDGDEECAPGFASISTGGGYACALDELQNLWCWGNNDRHQIDAHADLTIPFARRIGTRKFETISASRAHTCGISDGKIFCWGANEHGEITNSITGDVVDQLEIQITGGPQSWRSVSAGFETTCAISDAGQLFCWGAGSFGQLGSGGKADLGSPTPVMTTLSDWTAVVQGGGELYGQHTCALSASTGMWCWGSNAYSQLGDGTTTESSVPVQVALPGVTAIAPAAYSTCAVSAGALYCWGYSSAGSVGDPALIVPGTAVSTPTLASTVTGWTEVSAAELLVCGIAAGDVYCWGTSRRGDGIGDGVWNPATSFTRIAREATHISVGTSEYLDDAGSPHYDLDNSCYLGGSAVRCWGDNRFGQLGQGATTQSAVPLEVSGGRTWLALATGANHACGLDGTGIACWGSTLAGAVDGRIAGTVATPCTDVVCDPSEPQPVAFASALAIGSDHTCALDTGVVRCWGDDVYLQLGAPSVGPGLTAVPGAFTALLDVHGVSGCGRNGPDYVCWGNGSEPAKLDQLAALTTITTFGIGSSSSGYRSGGCALDTTGQLFCFGDNTLGQFGNGPSPTVCGDLICGPGDCELCPSDCTVACTTCGDGTCDNGETAGTCGDCGAGPTLSALPRHYLAISAGWDVDDAGVPACGVALDGTVECWGRNVGHMITNAIEPGDTMIPVYATTPHTIAGLASCTSVAVGASHACALCGGQIECWGDHSSGAVGSGTLTADPVLIPRAIDLVLPAGEAWAELQSGSGYSCARTSAGRAFCWGSNEHGALGLGASASTLPILVRTR